QIARRISHAFPLFHRWPTGRRSPLSIARREEGCGVLLPQISLCRQALVRLLAMIRAHRGTLCFRLDTAGHSCSSPLEVHFAARSFNEGKQIVDRAGVSALIVLVVAAKREARLVAPFCCGVGPLLL